MDNRTQLEADGYTVVAYENLSARGKELYVQTLRNDGRHTVSLGRGAADFTYPTQAERNAVESFEECVALESIVIRTST